VTPKVARVGASYLRIVGPVYVCFGLGLGCSSYAKDTAAACSDDGERGADARERS